MATSNTIGEAIRRALGAPKLPQEDVVKAVLHRGKEAK